MALFPVRADHVGSLLRPPALKLAHKNFRDGRIDDAALRSQVDAAVTDAVVMQEITGIGIVTDGEFRRGSWFLGFVDAVNGIALEQVPFRFTAEGVEDKTWHAPVIRSKLKRTRPIVLDDFKFLKSIASRIPKVTLPTPSIFHFFGGVGGIDPKIYPDIDKFFHDLAEVYRSEIADLYEAGCRYLQLDEVPLALLCDARIRERVATDGHNPERLTDLYIKAINDALAGVMPDMCIVIHLCRGNYRGRWMGSGGYDAIAEKLFNEINVDGFLLEFDSERSGTFEPLRFLPSNKRAFLGIISSKTAVLEDEDDLVRRFEEATRYAPIDRLGLCPQCGFASSAGGNPVTAETQQAKLELTVKTSMKIWGSI